MSFTSDENDDIFSSTRPAVPTILIFGSLPETELQRIQSIAEEERATGSSLSDSIKIILATDRKKFRGDTLHHVLALDSHPKCSTVFRAAPTAKTKIMQLIPEMMQDKKGRRWKNDKLNIIFLGLRDGERFFVLHIEK